jgi:hypothetical protein
VRAALPDDSLRGTVLLVGADPAARPVLRPAAGKTDVVLHGKRRVLERLGGLEVAVFGAREASDAFRVDRVEVRGANGVAAVDGTLVRAGDRWLLATADGRRLPVARLPESLRTKEGARVWLAGPLDRDPDSFGVIEDAP